LIIVFKAENLRAKLKAFHRGDTKRYHVTSLSNLFGGVLRSTWKKSLKDTDADALAQLTGTYSDPDEDGHLHRGTFELPAATSALFPVGVVFYDIEYTAADGRVITIDSGHAVVLEDATREAL
jgi:hypothetical protein